jgi:hypothetical protein
LLATAATAGCALAGYVLAPARTVDRPVSAKTAASDGVSLRYSSSFHPVRPTAEFRMAAPLMLARADDPRMTVRAGLTTAEGPTLLADDLTSRLDRVPAPKRVRLGPNVALRYDDLRPSGSANALRAYAVPTTAGVATVLCAAPTASLRAFTPDCERIAQTMRPLAGRAFPAGPRVGYAREVDGALQRLSRVRRDGLARMRAARSRSGQAAAARTIGGEYGRAAATMRRLDVSPYDRRATRDLWSKLGAAQRGYARLASAAAAGDRTSYTAAQSDLRRAEPAAAAAADRLRSLGYAVKH